jgi:hypothetical protein
VAFAFNPHAFLDDLSRNERKERKKEKKNIRHISDIREYKAHIVDVSNNNKKRKRKNRKNRIRTYGRIEISKAEKGPALLSSLQASCQATCHSPEMQQQQTTTA